MNIDVQLPEVQSFAKSARFFDDKGIQFVEISFIGSKDTIVKKVTPEIMTEFRPAWDAYCDGKPMQQRPGTPLTELPGISKQLADEFIRRNVHSLEELAVLTDHHCQAFGHGVINLRKQAYQLVAARQAADATRRQDKVMQLSASVGPRPAEGPNPEMDAVKAVVADQGKKIDLLIEAIGKLAEQKPRRGRPPKQQNA